MSFSKLAVIASCVAAASAHGFVTGIVIDGVYSKGWELNYAYTNTPPEVVGWGARNLDSGFVEPNNYKTADIICAKDASNAKKSADAKGGSTVEFQWNTWPTSHQGGIVEYLANCNGPCETVDKTTLKFFKISEAGLVGGKFVTDNLIANNNTWSTKIPTDIAPGNYVLRHELFGLHGAGGANGAQNYPQCFNLKIASSGTLNPPGILGTALYTPTDPGILVNIYPTPQEYVIPGPPLYNAGGASAPATPATSANPPAAPAASTKAASAAPTKAAAAPTKAAATPTKAAATPTKAAAAPTKEAVVTAPSSAPVTPASGNSALALPAGAKFSDVIGWLSTLYSQAKTSTKTRRAHARDVLAQV